MTNINVYAYGMRVWGIGEGIKIKKYFNKIRFNKITIKQNIIWRLKRNFKNVIETVIITTLLPVSLKRPYWNLNIIEL